MALLGRADEIVVGAAERLHHAAEDGRVPVRQLDRGDPLLLGGLLHLLAVLVGAGQEEDVLAVEPLEARQHVGRDRGVGVADMGYAVGIENRRRDVEFWRLHRRLALLDFARGK